jgi:hypothetical protein
MLPLSQLRQLKTLELSCAMAQEQGAWDADCYQVLLLKRVPMFLHAEDTVTTSGPATTACPSQAVLADDCAISVDQLSFQTNNRCCRRLSCRFDFCWRRCRGRRSYSSRQFRSCRRCSCRRCRRHCRGCYCRGCCYRRRSRSCRKVKSCCEF